jgi:hypothetical protein
VQGFFHSFHGGHIHIGVERWAAASPGSSRVTWEAPAPCPSLLPDPCFLTH